MNKKLVVCLLGIMVSPAYANQVETKIVELENQILLLKQQMEDDRKVQQNFITQHSVHDKFHRTLILSGFCLLKIAKISLNSSFFPKPIKR